MKQIGKLARKAWPIAMVVAVCFAGRIEAQGIQNQPGTVSSQATGAPHQWTMEEMLLAEPMPMPSPDQSPEDRQHLLQRKQLQTIRQWSLSDFEQFADVKTNEQYASETVSRWIGVRHMLRTKVGITNAFLAHKRADTADPKSTRQSETGNPFEPAWVDEIRRTPIENLDKGDFVVDDMAFSKTNVANTFDKIKSCRQDISDLSKEFERLQRKAKDQGRDRQLDWVLSTSDQR